MKASGCRLASFYHSENELANIHRPAYEVGAQLRTQEPFPKSMPSGTTILPIARQPSDIRRFLAVAERVYKNDSHWVAPLRQDRLKTFSDANPFFAHASMQLWVARRKGRDVGRIAGIINRLYNQRQDLKTAFFGFFESENEPDTSQRLFQAVDTWARQQGFKRVMGPVNPSTNDECGLLVDGFNAPPVFMMPYNPPYYADLLRASGFQGAMDLLAYHIDLKQTPLDRLKRIQERFQKRHPDITVRPLRRDIFWEDLEKIRRIYNDAWENNWGFVPMTDGEIRFMANRLKPLLVEGLVWIAETEREPVGFLLAVPDFNQPLKPLNGRLLTPRVLKFLPYLFGWKTPEVARVMVLGVKKSFRRRGVESVMLANGLKTGADIGLRACEASWVLENNFRSRRVIEIFGGTPYKTYRLYDRAL